MTGVTMLTQALALTKTKTEPTSHEASTCPDCGSGVLDGEHLDPDRWPCRAKGFGSNMQQLGRGVRRVPRA